MIGVFSQCTRQALAQARAPLVFSLHTTVAALFALALANAADIHHPWWAAMTVWLVAQPTRGLFIERCIARMAGSVVGALVGGLLLYFFFAWPNLLLCLLALWLALCAAIGNFFRHFRNYAWVLAGYTAAIVALFGLADPVLDPELASGRVICTLLGILCSSCVSWLFTAKSEPSVLVEERLDALVSDCLHWCMVAPAQTAEGADLSRVLGAIKTLDGVLDLAAAGSRAGRQRYQRFRKIGGVALLSYRSGPLRASPAGRLDACPTVSAIIQSMGRSVIDGAIICSAAADLVLDSCGLKAELPPGLLPYL